MNELKEMMLSTLLLVQIAKTLTHINIEDMTTAEKQIAEMLAKRNILIKGEEEVYTIYQDADKIKL